MHISLILGTLNRVKEIGCFFRSLKAQIHTDFDVILVDQNPDTRLVELVTTYRQHFPILHLRQREKGLSRARNVGRQHVSGQIVAFPDDDSVYPPNTLAHVAHFMANEPTQDCVVARIFALDKDVNAYGESGGDDHSSAVNYWKGYMVGISHAMFFRAHVIQALDFDDKMGVGSGTPWGANEDTDYMFRCLNAGYNVYYDATLIVRHPTPAAIANYRQRIRREFSYGLGNGYVIGKHTLPAPLAHSATRWAYHLTVAEARRGNWRSASAFLMSGIGTSIGYWAGRKRRWEISRAGRDVPCVNEAIRRK